jgi:hypothetical protein
MKIQPTSKSGAADLRVCRTWHRTNMVEVPVRETFEFFEIIASLSFLRKQESNRREFVC